MSLNLRTKIITQFMNSDPAKLPGAHSGKEVIAVGTAWGWTDGYIYYSDGSEWHEFIPAKGQLIHMVGDPVEDQLYRYTDDGDWRALDDVDDLVVRQQATILELDVNGVVTGGSEGVDFNSSIVLTPGTRLIFESITGNDLDTYMMYENEHGGEIVLYVNGNKVVSFR